MPPMKTTAINRTRRRLAYSIAANIEARFSLGLSWPAAEKWDRDVAADLIAALLPRDRVEMAAEIEAFCKSEPGPAQKTPPEETPIGQLRLALGLPMNATLRETLAAATATANAHAAATPAKKARR